jgi:hypothetical protein
MMTIRKEVGLKKKLLLDLSKNQVLNLIDTDIPITISLDAEGKIIGYRPFVSKMPTYWNSEITKRLLIKNNFFFFIVQKRSGYQFPTFIFLN